MKREAATVRRLFASLSPSALEVLAVLRAHGAHAFVVGGAVRDVCLGRRPHDFDVAVDLPVQVLVRIFAGRLAHTKVRHATVLVLTATGPVQVSGLAGPPAPLEVWLRHDLSHRDFTINAMAVDVEARRLIDLHNGRADLHRRVLRAVGEVAERFAEDPLRRLRALRLSAVLGLRLNRAVRAALYDEQGLGAVAWERRGEEMQKLLRAGHPATALRHLRATAMWRDVAPDVVSRGRGGGSWIDVVPPQLALRLAAWCWGLGVRAADVGPLAKRWCVARDVRAQASALVTGLGCLSPRRAPTGVARRAWAQPLGAAAATDAWRIAHARWPTVYRDPRGTGRALSQACLGPTQLAVSGDDLLAHGVPPRDIGVTLATLVRRVILRPRDNRRAVLLRLVPKLPTDNP